MPTYSLTERLLGQPEAQLTTASNNNYLQNATQQQTQSASQLNPYDLRTALTRGYVGYDNIRQAAAAGQTSQAATPITQLPNAQNPAFASTGSSGIPYTPGYGAGRPMTPSTNGIPLPGQAFPSQPSTSSGLPDAITGSGFLEGTAPTQAGQIYAPTQLNPAPLPAVQQFGGFGTTPRTTANWSYGGRPFSSFGATSSFMPSIGGQQAGIGGPYPPTQAQPSTQGGVPPVPASISQGGSIPANNSQTGVGTYTGTVAGGTGGAQDISLGTGSTGAGGLEDILAGRTVASRAGELPADLSTTSQRQLSGYATKPITQPIGGGGVTQVTSDTFGPQTSLGQLDPGNPNFATQQYGQLLSTGANATNALLSEGNRAQNEALRGANQAQQYAVGRGNYLTAAGEDIANYYGQTGENLYTDLQNRGDAQAQGAWDLGQAIQGREAAMGATGREASAALGANMAGQLSASGAQGLAGATNLGADIAGGLAASGQAGMAGATQLGTSQGSYLQGLGGDLATSAMGRGAAGAGVASSLGQALGTEANALGGQIGSQQLGVAGAQSAMGQGIQGLGVDAYNRAQMQLALEGAQNAQGQQQSSLDALREFRQGPEGPSAAEQQLKLGMDQAMRQQLSLARSGRGTGVNAAALRQALEANTGTSQRLAGETALLRAREAEARRGQDLSALGIEQQTTGQMRGQSLQEALGAANVGLQSQAQRDAAAQGYLGLGLNAEQLANVSRATGIQAQTSQQQAAMAAVQRGLEAGLSYDQALAQAGIGAQAALAQSGSQAALQGAQMGLGYNQALQLGGAQAQSNLAQAGLSYDQALQLGGAQAQTALTQAGLGYDQALRGLGVGAETQMAQAGLAQALGYNQLGAGTLTDLYGQALQGATSFNELANQAQLGGMGLEQVYGQNANAAQMNALNAAIAANQGYTGMGNDLLRTQAELELQRANLQSGYAANALNASTQRAIANQQAAAQQEAAIFNAAGTILASDVRAKEDIEQAPPGTIAQALGRVPTKSFEYKPSAQMSLGQPPGRQFGMMAQDMEREPALQGAVNQGPGGMRSIDQGRLSMLTASALGEQQREIADLRQQLESVTGDQEKDQKKNRVRDWLLANYRPRMAA